MGADDINAFEDMLEKMPQKHWKNNLTKLSGRYMWWSCYDDGRVGPDFKTIEDALMWAIEGGE